MDAPDGTAARPLAPAVQHDLDLDGGVATGVEDLAADDVDDLAHTGTVSGGAGSGPVGEVARHGSQGWTVLKLAVGVPMNVDVDEQKSPSPWPSPTLADSIVSIPMLPPVLDPHEQEPLIMPVVTRAYEHTPHTNPDLLGTERHPGAGQRRLVGSVVGYSIAAVALVEVVPAHHRRQLARRLRRDPLADAVDDLVVRHGLPRLGRVGDDGVDQWTSGCATGLVAVAAAVCLPCSGPLRRWPARSTSRRPTATGSPAPIVWVCIGHGVGARVPAQLGSSHRRRLRQFTKLIWFPLASLGYRVIATIVLPDTSFNNTALFTALVAIDVMLMMATAVAVWRAMRSFDQACARDRYSSVENQLPAFMASAHH